MGTPVISGISELYAKKIIFFSKLRLVRRAGLLRLKTLYIALWLNRYRTLFEMRRLMAPARQENGVICNLIFDKLENRCKEIC
jgi:hypothetical protein